MAVIKAIKQAFENHLLKKSKELEYQIILEVLKPEDNNRLFNVKISPHDMDVLKLAYSYNFTISELIDIFKNAKKTS